MNANKKPNFTVAALSLSVDNVINISRLALSSLSLVALYIDPIDNYKFADYAYVASTMYAIYAALTYLFDNAGRTPKLAHAFSYVADFSFSSALVFLTGGASSPLSMLLSFPLLVATLRWNWRGAITTCALLIALLVGLSFADDGALTGAHDDINRFVIGGAFLLVAGLMLGHVGAFRERSLERLAVLASWPPEVAAAGEFPQLEPSLAHAAATMRAHRVLVLWEQEEEPFLFISVWVRGQCKSRREEPGKYGELVATELSQTAFMIGEPQHDRAIAKQIGSSEPLLSLNQNLAWDYGITRFVTAPFTTQNSSGRVFILEPDSTSGELIALTSIVANRVSIEIEHHILRMELDAAAASAERARLARDMHDGILQTLTAIGLRLASGMENAGQSNIKTLNESREMLADAQRRLREFVNNAYAAKGISLDDGGYPVLGATEVTSKRIFDLEAECSKALGEASRHWKCSTHLRVSPQGAQVVHHIGRQILPVLAEAVANATQHGGASTIKVEVTRRMHSLELIISDDGNGLPGPTGEFDHETVFLQRIGPKTIRDRVLEVRGDLTISNSSSGLTLKIGIPIR
jgi:signal transduction histidine kinase